MDWSSLINIDRTWHSEVLTHHFTEINGKVTVCLHTVQAAGTQIRSDYLVRKLVSLMPDFVLGKKKAEELGDAMEIAFRACQYFGNIDPQKDGKYGELLLFALVESQLGCKMVAHKVRALSSMNDQVKGGDGVFLGEYKVSEGKAEPAYFIGESKVVSNFNYALADAMTSLYRVHDPGSSHLFREAEWVVALDHLVEGDFDIDELYRRLDYSTPEFQSQILVHPVLIMYDSGAVKESERASTSKDELEKLLSSKVTSFVNDMISSINKHLEKFTEMKAVHLHFFMIPFNDVAAFRNSMYSRIHNAEYRAKQDKGSKTIAKPKANK